MKSTTKVSAMKLTDLLTFSELVKTTITPSITSRRHSQESARLKLSETRQLMLMTFAQGSDRSAHSNESASQSFSETSTN